MNLRELIESVIYSNTLIRLWYKCEEGEDCAHIMVGENQDVVAMEHETLKGEGPFGEYLDNRVIGITDILIPKGSYTEAVNIVIERSGEKDHKSSDL